MAEGQASRFVFPRWANYLLPLLVLGAVGGGMYVPVLVGFGLSADTLWRGYAPSQPIEFSHATHAGDLGMDCRHCHGTVEEAGFAAVPDTETCISCHTPEEGVAGIRKESPAFGPLYAAYQSGEPIRWEKVHNMPDFVVFDHSAHVNRGVSCMECHGRVDRMEVVYKAESMSMAWCLDCHAEPEKHLRPPEEVTNFDWDPRDHEVAQAKASSEGRELSRDEAQLAVGRHIRRTHNIHDPDYMMSCSTCHQ